MRHLLIGLALATIAVSGGTPRHALGQAPSSVAAAQAGDAGITANGVIGEVAAVDAGAKQMFVKTDAGSVVVVMVADNTIFMRVPPGESTLDKAARVTFAEVSAGDRVFARGKPSDDRKTVAARMVIINTKSDIGQKQERERAEWKRRGVVGVISALNPQTKEITLQARGAEAAQPVTVVSVAGTKFRRYASDSVKFSDAKESTFEQLKVGDQLRAKGDKSEDGTRFTAEEVVTGAFRTVVGTITAVAADQNSFNIKTLEGDQPLTVVVSRDSMLKRIPAEFGAMMGGGGGRRDGGGGAQAGGGGGGRQATSPPASDAGAGEGRRRAGMRGDMQEMLERLPPTTLAELEPGRMIVFSTTSTDATRVTAIQLLAGVEQLVAMMQGGGRGAGNRGGGGAGGGGGGIGAGAGGVTFGFGIGAP